MLAVKGSTVESGLLRLTTDLRPKAVKTCKWTEKASTTSRFLNLFDHLVLLADNKDSRVNFDTRNSFKLQTQKFSRQWDAFAQLHGRLQEDGLPRNKGQILINTLHKTIEENREKRGHPFQGCELKNTHSMLGNRHETNHDFSAGVNKIQNKKEGQLTITEKNACLCLLKSNHPNWSGLYTHNQEDDLSVEEEPISQDSTFSMESIFRKESKKAEEVE